MRVPNGLDERIWSTPSSWAGPRTKGPVRILYMGTATHDAELAFLKTIAVKLRKKFGDRVAFDVIGITSRHGVSSIFNRVSPAHSNTSYPGFVEWFLREPRWDVGVTPLVDTYFNQVKSNIKLLDYAALGLPIVASDVEPYKGCLARRRATRPERCRCLVRGLG